MKKTLYLAVESVYGSVQDSIWYSAQDSVRKSIWISTQGSIWDTVPVWIFVQDEVKASILDPNA